MRGRRLTVRAIALLGAGSAAIHQLRYAIGYGSAAPHALAAHGHGYLEIALPAVMTAALIALASVLMRVAHGGRVATRGSALSFAWLWLACSVALAAIYGIQETIEGSGAFAGSGWIGLALAVPAGLLVALALRGASAAESLRATGGILRASVVDVFVDAVDSSLAPRRLPDLRHGARAPPVAFVV